MNLFDLLLNSDWLGGILSSPSRGFAQLFSLLFLVVDTQITAANLLGE